MRLIPLLIFVVVGCFALGLYLHANLINVAVGLAIGGGVGGVLTLLIRYLQPRNKPE